jgi:beta-N-acetylhexosaminidase
MDETLCSRKSGKIEIMPEIAATTRHYNPSTDAAAVFLLWQTTAGQTWPIDFQRFRQVLSAPGAHHFVAMDRDQVVGFVATMQSQRQNTATGHLLTLLVAPTHQRQGRGSALHTTALHYLQAAGVQLVQLGGLSPRFWCGVPENLSATLPFFRALGWEFDQPVYDLVQDLHRYTTPPDIYSRLLDQQIMLATAKQEDIPEVLAFEQREYPNWLPHYERCSRLGDYQDILLARNASGQVAGTLLLYTPQSHSERTDVIWRVLLGYDAGAMGAVGVSPSEQGRGIGIALVARASDLLKERGIRNCTIDWVEITNFYAKLGYKKWRAFLTSWREL